MGISVKWFDAQQRSIYVVFDSRYNATDVDAATQMTTQMYEESGHSAVVVLDMRALRTLPKDTFLRLPRIAMRLPKIPPTIIAVGARHNIANMVDIFSELYSEIRQVKTMQEAESLMQRSYADRAAIRPRTKDTPQQQAHISP